MDLDTSSRRTHGRRGSGFVTSPSVTRTKGQRGWSPRCPAGAAAVLRRGRRRDGGSRRRRGRRPEQGRQLLGQHVGVGWTFRGVIFDAVLQKGDHLGMATLLQCLFLPAAAAGRLPSDIAGEHLIPDHAQRVDIVARVGRAATALLGRGVQRGATAGRLGCSGSAARSFRAGRQRPGKRFRRCRSRPP